MASVPRLFPESTIVCIGGGPSLLPADVELCRGRARVIAINDAYRLAPWADVLYAADLKWWAHHAGVPDFEGRKYAVTSNVQSVADFKAWPDIDVLKQATEVEGMSRDPSALCIGPFGGANSGYQAIGLAVHLGASRIVLLGYDMAPGERGESHWFGEHPQGFNPMHFGRYARAFDTLVDPLKARGIEVINCSRRTALTQFPRLPLDQVLVSDTVAA